MLKGPRTLPRPSATASKMIRCASGTWSRRVMGVIRGVESGGRTFVGGVDTGLGASQTTSTATSGVTSKAFRTPARSPYRPIQLGARVAGAGEAGAGQPDPGGAAEPPSRGRQLVEDRVVLGGDVVPVDDELHARHRLVLSGDRDGPRPSARANGQSLAGAAGSVNAAWSYNGANPYGGRVSWTRRPNT